MAQMYLTTFHNTGNERPVTKHEEVEMLLETYYTQLEDNLNRIREVIMNIKSTKEFLQITLDSVRNRMMYIELRLNIGVFALAVGTFIAGLFGMNLMSHMEEKKYGCKYIIKFSLFCNGNVNVDIKYKFYRVL
jgi:magnesium transporter